MKWNQCMLENTKILKFYGFKSVFVLECAYFYLPRSYFSSEEKKNPIIAKFINFFFRNLNIYLWYDLCKSKSNAIKSFLVNMLDQYNLPS